MHYALSLSIIRGRGDAVTRIKLLLSADAYAIATCKQGLTSRFRNSHYCAAPSFANFGIEGHWQLYDSSVVFGFEVPKRASGDNDRNFKSSALAGAADSQFSVERLVIETSSSPILVERRR
jgi:hypothetical protein